MNSSSAGWRFIRTISAAIAAALMFSGCTSVRSVSPGVLSSSPGAVKIGEDVTCVLRDGSSIDLRVTAVEPTAIVGGERSVALADIDEIRVKRLDLPKTAKTTGKAAVTTVVVTAALLSYGALALAIR